MRWTFTENGSHRKHTENLHLGTDTEFECETCGKKCSTKTILQRHISSVHLKERDFKCDICTFGRGLPTQVNSVHLGIKKYACTTCGRSSPKVLACRSTLKSNIHMLH